MTDAGRIDFPSFDAEPDGRTCTATGLRLLMADGATAYRVAKDRGRPALEGYLNGVVGPLPASQPEMRGRWDTIGSTVYFAATPECAFAEVLAPLVANRARLTVAAERAGYASADEFAYAVLHQSADLEVDRPWAISGAWQYARSLYYVTMPTAGWWIQVDHPDSLDALRRQAFGLLPDHPFGELWASHLEGDNRALTTSLANHIRNLVLDDGSEPLGISYRSRTLYGRCFAWWDRRGDMGLGPGLNDPYLARSTNVDTPELRVVARRLGLPILPGRPAT